MIESGGRVLSPRSSSEPQSSQDHPDCGLYESGFARVTGNAEVGSSSLVLSGRPVIPSFLSEWLQAMVSLTGREKANHYPSSDAVIPSFTREGRIAHIIDQIPAEELDWFNTIGYTIGGMMVFPAHRVGRKMTINGARGFHPRIKDRFDLTVECIRRHYLNESSPLSDTLERYADFFTLFEDFGGYVEFFLLQDMVNEDFSAVKFSSPFDDFKTSPLPSSKDAYLSYEQLAEEFIEARNRRIVAFGEVRISP